MNLYVTQQTVPLRRGLVVDGKAKHLKSMRQAVWLYLYLLLAANPATGKRLVSPALIAQHMGLSEATVRSWLGRLRKSGYIKYEKQGAYFRVTMERWHETTARPGGHGGLNAHSLARQLDGDPDDPFWREVLALGQPDIVSSVLADVKRVPADRIKKSRVALFRYLIKKRLNL